MADQDPLERLADCARQASDTALRAWLPFRGEPAPGSVAAGEFERASDFDMPESASLVVLAHHVAAAPLTMAAEHLEAWAMLTESHQWVFVDVAVLRLALEACARSLWLTNPLLTVEQRLGRALSDFVHTAGKLDDTQGKAWVRQQTEWARQAANRFGITIPKYESTRQILKRLLDGGDTPNLGGRAWAMGSAYVHGGFWTSYGQSREVVIDSEADLRRLELVGRTPAQAANFLSLLLSAYAAAHHQRLTFYGMPTVEFARAMDALQRRVREIGQEPFEQPPGP